ncbi:N-acetyltransferase [Vibrio sp. T187]|uniref:GNAT family N-acetyltransferase n=1 Tax=Vibrio TaxID=662 RepID=UPI0010C956C2|nr:MULTISPECIES: GNAT family N-acetyltransferase [Vibrio]MBW3696034.1 N-acetyltransferase [Vibrio sp. T187]
MQLVPFEDEHASIVKDWFESKQDALMWGGRVFGWPLLSKAIIERSLANEIEFFVLMNQDELVGFIEFQTTSTNELRFCRVAVAPSSRGKGVGKVLIRAAIEKAKTNSDITVVTLAVFKNNVSAKKCYESIGFEVFDREPKYKVFDGQVWPLYQMRRFL